MAACILASAALSALYVRGGAGWPLGFVMLAPWLRALVASRTLAGTLLGAYAMSVAFTAACFAWFGAALGQYAGVGEGAGQRAAGNQRAQPRHQHDKAQRPATA